MRIVAQPGQRLTHGWGDTVESRSGPEPQYDQVRVWEGLKETEQSVRTHGGMSSLKIGTYSLGLGWCIEWLGDWLNLLRLEYADPNLESWTSGTSHVFVWLLDGPSTVVEVANSVSWAKLGQAQCSSHQVQPAQLAGILAHSAGSAGSQLNSAAADPAGWSAGSSDQCDSYGRLPGRLVGQGWLWAGGLFWSGHGHGQSVWACFRHVQEWFDSSRTSGNCHRQVRAFAGTPGLLLHPETQRKPEKKRERERESDCSIQDQEWCEGSKETVLWAITRGVENDPLMVIDHG
ncbi:hypothetical protein F2Q70_00011442 [Brassica cretica]|uniref:Uncharacterized protein n=1 Tax=Brassica cretica TaxID=69181 RepID=A0A8S9M7Q9_BRACR|nr:hypothetical protein F2Q70_00011442 [Brassica cretica]